MSQVDTILLLGGNGQIGTELRRSLADLGNVVVATRDGAGAQAVADLADPPSLAALVDRLRPAIVVNAAGHTGVDLAEGERELAFRINAEAPAVLAAACARHDAILVHYSTDYVFAGDGARPYREDDATAPLGAYGASKLAGEQAIRASGCRHLVFRTGWVYAAHGNNFLRTMLRLGMESDELRVVADQTGTPTPAGLVAVTTARVLRRSGRSGLWHLAATGQTTWHGFAEAIFAGAVARGLLARAPAVVPVTTAGYPTPARRPAYSVLDTSALRRDFGIELPDWEAGLSRVLDQFAA